MENIEIFLRAANAYGVPQSGLFACNDLYEGKNMPMVLATILQVGSEVRHFRLSATRACHVKTTCCVIRCLKY